MERKKILLIEDEVKLARFVELELKYEGYDVTVCHDGREGMQQIINEEYDIRSCCNFVDDGFKSFLKISSVFCAGNNRSHVKRDEALSCQNWRYVSSCDADCNSFYNCRFAHTRIADQHRVVLASST